jgi:type IV pilus assembly protein PilV
MRRHKAPALPAAQEGLLLIEALVALLIFSLGILAIIGLQAQSIRQSSDAKFRADAGFLASQIIGYVWADRTNLAQYSHRPNGPNGPNASPCSPGGPASGNANVQAWLANVNALLPGADGTRQSIAIDTATRRVTVTICWESRSGMHNHVVTTQLSG